MHSQHTYILTFYNKKCCKQSCADLEEMRAEIEGHRSQITEVCHATHQMIYLCVHLVFAVWRHAVCVCVCVVWRHAVCVFYGGMLCVLYGGMWCAC